MSQPSSSQTSTEQKLKQISDLIKTLNWEPKSYMEHFLNVPTGDSVSKRQLWGSSGWSSTRRLLDSIKKNVAKTTSGRNLWEDFILDEALLITRKEKPNSGLFPNGAYYSSKQIHEDFFTEDSRAERSRVIQSSMPFLYRLLLGKLARPKTKETDEEESSDDELPDDTAADSLETNPLDDENPGRHLSLTEDEAMEVDIDVFRPISNPTVHKLKQNEDMAQTICSMVAFGCNRRHNGMQMTNGLLFIACGVTERVNHYLNYIGLSSSRKSSHLALAALGKENESKIKHLTRNANSKILPPSICIDNLDFQQSIHTKSVGRSSTMFHGTWGYIHHLSPEFFKNLDHSQLTLAALKQSLKNSISLKVQPRHFGPTSASNEHFEFTLKSQITSVILRYIAYPTNKHTLLAIHPPPVRPIRVEKAKLTMLKLMMASDNSSEGIGEVCTGLIQQSGLTADQFSSQLQVIEGDLGTCMNISSLRQLRIPAGYSKTSLANLLAIPGAAHTMWNISQSIFLHHWGDQTNRQDTGAWRNLKALCIPADKPVTKRDFTLMISNMEKIYEANLLYCICLVMDKANKPIPEERCPMSPSSIQEVVNKTYDRFLSGKALDSATANKQVKRINFLLRLRDFSTVIEVNRATKAGDPGRLLYMWRRWAIMSQGLNKLVHYSRHLPKLILLLEVILPKSLASYIEHTLLLCPSGRSNHFVANDFYLEVQNYWLKYFYNHSGIGTNIERLRDVFSINIPTLKNLMQLLNCESGMRPVQQSHKNKLTNPSINSFLRFANQHNICEAENKPSDFIPAPIPNVYNNGIEKIKSDFSNKKGRLNHLKPEYLFDQEMEDPNGLQSTNDLSDSEQSITSDSSDLSESSGELIR